MCNMLKRVTVRCDVRRRLCYFPTRNRPTSHTRGSRDGRAASPTLLRIARVSPVARGSAQSGMAQYAIANKRPPPPASLSVPLTHTTPDQHTKCEQTRNHTSRPHARPCVRRFRARKAIANAFMVPFERHTRGLRTRRGTRPQLFLAPSRCAFSSSSAAASHAHCHAPAALLAVPPCPPHRPS